MLAKRIMTSIFLSAVLLAAIFIFPRPVVAIVVAVLIGIALWEFYGLTEIKGFSPFKIWGTLCGMILSVVTYLIKSGGYPLDIDKAISIMLSLILLITLTKYAFKKDGNTVIINSAVTMLGILYISFLFTFIIKLRYIPNPQEGKGWVMAVFILAKISDVFAYTCGMAFGKHKLIPRISPKKSIEGAVSAVIGTALVSLLLSCWFLKELSILSAIILGILISIVGQIGDLIESLIKRDAKVKDSGRIAPGMGGVLDFMDSLLFAGPVMYLFVSTI